MPAHRKLPLTDKDCLDLHSEMFFFFLYGEEFYNKYLSSFGNGRRSIGLNILFKTLSNQCSPSISN